MQRLKHSIWFLGCFLLTGMLHAQEAGFDWQALGANTYGRCAGCHARQGTGLEGAVPPLAGHLTNVLAAEGGRRYLINVLLYGLEGDITVLGKPYTGGMPAWGKALSDAEIAAVLNHELNSWGNDDLLPSNFTPIQPSEVAAERAAPKTAQEVYMLRPDIPADQ